MFSFAAEQKLILHHDDAKSLEQQQLFKHHLGVVEGAQQLFMVSVFLFIIFNCGCGGGGGGAPCAFFIYTEQSSSRIRTRGKISSS